MLQQKLLDDLREDLVSGKALVVAGTGVSIQATGNQPCASWKGLILNGIDHCVGTGLLTEDAAEPLRKQLAGKSVKKIVNVAEKVSKILGAPDGGEFRRWLQESVGTLELRHREIIDAIQALGAPIATTNYDDLLSRGRGIAAVPWTDVATAHQVVRGDRTGILHLHGYYDEPESVVLGVASYEKLLASRGAQAIQQALAAKSTLLFIGCGDGLSDPNVGPLLEWLADAFGTSVYRHYCLCRNGEQRNATDTRLFYLAYGDDYADLVPFLRELLPHKSAPAALPNPGYCIGREREVEQIVSALLADNPQPLPILGGPGMGKTTLALKALHDKRVAARFGARRWFIRCDGVKTRAALAAVMAQALGIPVTPDVEQAVLAALSADPAALVLDNAETPLDASRSEVEELLSAWATIDSLALVVTIRAQASPRGVPWRSRLEAHRLAPDAAREAFLAIARRPEFASDPHLDRLLEVLDGVPLAITLMARYGEVYDSLEPVWSSWNEKRTAMLKDETGADRLTNIEVSYELSIAVLSSEARRLLSVLAMLPEGVAQTDLPGVFSDAGDAAHELHRRALVFDEAKRLRMLAPLREYVAATHSPEDADERRVVEHYLRLAEREGVKVGKKGGSEAVARLAPEVANVEAMMARSGRGAYKPITQAIHGWGELMRFTGLGSSHVVEQVANQALAAGAMADAARSFESLGHVALHRSDLEGARGRYEHALLLYQKVGDLVGEAKCIESLGDIAFRRSDHEAARSRYEQALPLHQQAGKVVSAANCIQSLGDIALQMSDYEAAQTRYEQALPLYQKVGDLLGEANCILSLGDIALERPDREGARARYEQALLLYRKIADLQGEANCILSLGEMALGVRDHGEARTRFQQALPLYRRVGDLMGEANCNYGLGEIALNMGSPEEAEAFYSKSLELYERLPHLFSIGMTHWQLVRLATDDPTRKAHVAAARAAFLGIHREDLAAKLDAEFGTE